MNWMIFFFAAAGIFAFFLLWALVLGARKYKSGRVLSPFKLLFAGLFVTTVVLLIPAYAASTGGTPASGVRTVAYALHSTFQVFTIDADTAVIDEIDCGRQWLTRLYAVCLSVIYVTAPIMTFGFVLSFFKNVAAFTKYILHWFGKVYVFSELNDKSLAFAENIKKNHRRAVVVFTNVDSESKDELVEKAMELGAINLRKDVQTFDFSLHNRKSDMYFFAIAEREQENIEDALEIIERYRKRRNTRLYVFSKGVESELILTKADKGRMVVRRVNEIRSLINHTLFNEGHKLFETASPCADGTKTVSAVLVGMGQHGTEMLKGLTWYCQMDGYRFKANVFDSDPLAKDRFSAMCPELMDEGLNGKYAPGDAYYDITIHPGMDVTTKSFADKLREMTDVNYVLVSLGSDELNIRTAVELRMLFERMKIYPIIQTIVYSTSEKKALDGVENFKNQPYKIDFIGDRETIYSEAVIIDSDYERDALNRHLNYGQSDEADEAWQFEYNYRSSLASSIHKKARLECRIPGADKNKNELTDAERDTIQSLEHRRWNAYMRSEGYIFSGSHDPTTRNDLGKMHHDLVNNDILDPEEKKKDIRVGTSAFEKAENKKKR